MFLLYFFCPPFYAYFSRHYFTRLVSDKNHRKHILNIFLGCHSSKILHIFGKLDYSGIALLTMGSFVPWVYYTFYCETQSKIVYMATGLSTAIFYELMDHKLW